MAEAGTFLEQTPEEKSVRGIGRVSFRRVSPSPGEVGGLHQGRHVLRLFSAPREVGSIKAAVEGLV